MIKLEKRNFPLKWEDICELLNVDESLEEISVKLKAEKKVKTKKEKPDYDKNFTRAAEILKTLKDIEFPVELYRFGTYSQYEVAGEKVNKWDELSIWDDYDLENVLDRNLVSELDDTLSFLNKKYIKSIGCEMYGQNVLVLNEDGTTEFDGFRI